MAKLTLRKYTNDLLHNELMTNSQWFLIETKDDYEAAITRYEVVKHAQKGSDEHRRNFCWFI